MNSQKNSLGIVNAIPEKISLSFPIELPKEYSQKLNTKAFVNLE